MKIREEKAWADLKKWFSKMKNEKLSLQEIVKRVFSDAAEEKYLDLDPSKRKIVDKVIQDGVNDPESLKKYKDAEFHPLGFNDWEIIIKVNSIRLTFTYINGDLILQDIEE